MCVASAQSNWVRFVIHGESNSLQHSTIGLAFLLVPLSQPHPRAAAVLVDEFDADGIYPSLKTLIKFQFVLPTCNL